MDSNRSSERTLIPYDRTSFSFSVSLPIREAQLEIRASCWIRGISQGTFIVGSYLSSHGELKVY